jgi:type IV secretory pathway VirB9-like protein
MTTDGYIKVENSSSGSTCFDAGTQITLYDVTYKNIEDIVIGDKVMSYNVCTKQLEQTTVIKPTRAKVNKNLVILTFSDGSKIYTTTTHPFYTSEG